MKIFAHLILLILLSVGLPAFSQATRNSRSLDTEKQGIKKDSARHKDGFAKWLFGGKNKPAAAMPAKAAKMDSGVKTELPTESEDLMKNYADFNLWYKYRVVRPVLYDSTYHQLAVEIRKVENPYRRPVQAELIWSPLLISQFKFYYPAHTDWRIEEGQKIGTVSAYQVWENVGALRRVYGKVLEVYFTSIDENYVLYIGDHFPYQDLSVVVPFAEMRKISRHPESYFKDQNVCVNGLISLWDGKPEIIVRSRVQVRRY